ncbi:MAG TPA: carbamate kinase [Thermoanaerobaculia bacterium]|nr:carbamate kinase [Thermoanaerobaculia bacterium]
MRVVLAVGGNALLRRGEPFEYAALRTAIAAAARPIAAVAREHRVIITHGNGPQIGWLALRSEGGGHPSGATLDVLGAESEGMIGYLIVQQLSAELPGRPVAVLLTQVVVDPGDPAFSHPTKPIGAVHDEAAARRLETERGWQLGPETGGWRRLVPSPEPRRIVELETIRLLLDADRVVVCAGGGGIPVQLRPDGATVGVEAVVDKDLTSALLARELRTELLVLLTDVEAIYRDWPQRRDPIGRTTPAELRRLSLEEGSMGPKVEAACRFVESTGGRTAIGSVEQAAELVAGTSGTQVVAR